MANQITIDVSAVKRWAKEVSTQAVDRTQREINLALKNAANLVQRQEAKEMPRGATGKMASTIRQIVTTESATIGPDPTLDYPLYVHEGTNPHMPPVDAITAWADARGINPWALAKSIAKKGTVPNRFVPRTFDDTSDAIEQEFVTASEMILNFLVGA